jgi:hypothetical protein
MSDEQEESFHQEISTRRNGQGKLPDYARY